MTRQNVEFEAEGGLICSVDQQVRYFGSATAENSRARLSHFMSNARNG
jgi:hypothetical protein